MSADDKVKKTKKQQEAMSDSPDAATAAAAEKAARKAAKKEAKKRKREAAAAAAQAQVDDSTEPDQEEQEPKRKKNKKAQSEAAQQQDNDDDQDSEKAKRKEEKKAKKDKKKDKSKKESNGDEATSTASTSTPTVIAPSDASAARDFLKTNNITIEVPDDDSPSSSSKQTPLPMIAFSELKPHLQPALWTALESQGFKAPTPIQACCWPILLGGSDVVGIAETGSGKTFAFGLPALQLIASTSSSSSSEKKSKGKSKAAAHVSMLVVAPTRELAIQTHENLALLATPLGIGSICLFGGVSKHDQISALQSSSPPIRIVVGTPGRILDLARGSDHFESALDLSHVQYLVLDEADRMLDKGFEPDIRAIIGMSRSHTHPEGGRHTSMFSATWPPAVRGLAESFMRNPTRVTVGSDELSANRRVSQEVEVLDDGRAKERRLGQILNNIARPKKGSSQPNKDKILIFALYKKEAQRVEQNLRRNGYAVSGIHGDLSQQDRMSSLENFKTAKTPLLVATDVAARGLDIPNVEYVINYTFPLTIEDYVHRIGRTGRGGKTGKSITFFTEEDKAHAGELMRVLKDADQPVPEEMNRFPTTIKKKSHSAFGDHYRDLVPGKAKKITFD
ncbi:RNA-dependent ATPase [Tilletia horrida]|nr:RNA-dependent ATPase [Tilletia horrida]